MKRDTGLAKILKENIVYILLILIFIFLFLVIKLQYRQLIINLDEKILYFFDRVINPQNTSFMKLITRLGDWYVIIGLIVLTFIFFKDKKNAIFMALNSGWACLLNQIVKYIFKRQRPLTVLVRMPTTYSFPSSHAMISMATYILLWYFIQRKMKSGLGKTLLLILFIAIIIYIGISRMYLNVHFFTDVIAGFILGLLGALMFISIYKRNFGEQ